MWWVSFCNSQSWHLALCARLFLSPLAFKARQLLLGLLQRLWLAIGYPLSPVCRSPHAQCGKHPPLAGGSSRGPTLLDGISSLSAKVLTALVLENLQRASGMLTNLVFLCLVYVCIAGLRALAFMLWCLWKSWERCSVWCCSSSTWCLHSVWLSTLLCWTR